jgi:phosphoesterase RecJ-like protein
MHDILFYNWIKRTRSKKMELDDIVKILKEQDSFIITSHEAADADAIGSLMALYSCVKVMGKMAVPLLSDPVAEKYHFLDEEKIILSYQELGGKIIPSLPIPGSNKKIKTKDSCLIVLDTVPHNIGKMGDTLLPAVKSVVVIDHHDWLPEGGCQAWLEPGASSTCEMIYDLLSAMEHRMDIKTAEALYAGIIYDTGSFIYPKTSAKSFRIAESLVNSGVIPNKIYTNLYENKSVAALLLQTRVLQSMVLYQNNSIAVLHMPKEYLSGTGAHYDEAQEIINIPLQSRDVRVSLFFKENADGVMRCSMRSKGEVNCASLSLEFGGGGHRTAAGFKMHDSFEVIRDTLLDKLAPFF